MHGWGGRLHGGEVGGISEEAGYMGEDVGPGSEVGPGDMSMESSVLECQKNSYS